jgi:hypothetical protein
MNMRYNNYKYPEPTEPPKPKPTTGVEIPPKPKL